MIEIKQPDTVRATEYLRREWRRRTKGDELTVPPLELTEAVVKVVMELGEFKGPQVDNLIDAYLRRRAATL